MSEKIALSTLLEIAVNLDEALSARLSKDPVLSSEFWDAATKEEMTLFAEKIWEVACIRMGLAFQGPLSEEVLQEVDEQTVRDIICLKDIFAGMAMRVIDRQDILAMTPRDTRKVGVLEGFADLGAHKLSRLPKPFELKVVS